MNKELINKRFIEAVNYLLSQNIVESKVNMAERLGIKPSKLSEILNSRMNVGTDLIASLCHLYNIDANWMLLGTGEMNKIPSSDVMAISDSDIQILHHPKMTEKSGQHTIKLYDIAAAANLKTLFDNKNQNILGEITIPDCPKCDGAMYVNGDSMYPLLKSGDIIAYKEIYDFNYVIYGEMYLISFSLDGDEYLSVKYINKSDNDTCIKLVSYNTHHQPMDIPMNCINAMGLIKFSIRKNTML